jgi:hypothetical protein
MELAYCRYTSGFVVYFIGGYLLYSSFYAAIGAAVNEIKPILNSFNAHNHAAYT